MQTSLNYSELLKVVLKVYFRKDRPIFFVLKIQKFHKSSNLNSKLIINGEYGVPTCVQNIFYQIYFYQENSFNLVPLVNKISFADLFKSV